MQVRQAITANFAAIFLSRIIGVLGPILLVPLFIGTWGLDVYGEWLILTAIPAYIMLSPDFGLAGAVINRMAYLTSQGNEKEAVFLYRSSFLVLVVGATTFVCLGWLIAWSVDWSFVGVTSLDPHVSSAIIGWSCVRIFIAQQGYLLSGIYRSARKNPRLGLLNSIGALFFLGVSLVALSLDSNPYQYVVALATAHALFFLIHFIDSRRIMPSFTLSWHGVSLRRVRPYIVPGLGHAGMPLIHALQNQGVLIVLGSILGPTSVGLFQTARVLSNGVKSMLGILAIAIMVELPMLLGEGRRKLVERLLVRNSQIGVLLAMCAIATMILAGESIYRIWLGNEIPYHSMIVLLLLISLLPFVVGQSFIILLQASNQIHLAILPLILVAFISIGCVGVGAYLAGLSGSALGVFIWEAGMAAVVVITVSRGNVKLHNYFYEFIKLKLLLNDLIILGSRIKHVTK